MNCSFIVIAHKSSGTLVRCLESISTISENGDELILVLNNPDVKTAEIAAKLINWKIIHESKPGPAFARNAGAKAASNPVLCFMDSDVGIFKEYKKILKDKMSNPWIVAGQFRIEPERNPTLLCALKRFNYIAFNSRFFTSQGHLFPILDTANLSIRKDWFDRQEGFNTNFRYLEDTEFSLRLLREGADFFFDSRYSLTEFTDSEESLVSYLTKPFHKNKYIPKLFASFSIEYQFPFSQSFPGKELLVPNFFLKVCVRVMWFFQLSGIACSPYPLYLQIRKSGRVAKNQKKYLMTGMDPYLRSIWVNDKEKIYDWFTRSWKLSK